MTTAPPPSRRGGSGPAAPDRRALRHRQPDVAHIEPSGKLARPRRVASHVTVTAGRHVTLAPLWRQDSAACPGGGRAACLSRPRGGRSRNRGRGPGFAAQAVRGTGGMTRVADQPDPRTHVPAGLSVGADTGSGRGRARVVESLRFYCAGGGGWAHLGCTGDAPGGLCCIQGEHMIHSKLVGVGTPTSSSGPVDLESPAPAITSAPPCAKSPSSCAVMLQ